MNLMAREMTFLNLLHTLSLTFICAGMLSLGLMLCMTHDLQKSLPLGLDFWMGAGFLKLFGNPSWTVIMATATIVFIRKFLMLSYKTSNVRPLKH
jgi:uncharacterized membrane protein